MLRKFRPEIEADSAGTSPAIPISEAAKIYLKRENAQKHLKHAPEDLDEKELGSYDLIIAMKPRHKEAILRKCPNCAHRIVVWDIDDPYFLPHGHAEKIFKQIRDMVTELVNSM